MNLRSPHFHLIMMLTAIAVMIGVAAAGAYLVWQEYEQAMTAQRAYYQAKHEQEAAEATAATVANLAQELSAINSYFVNPDTVSRVIEDLEKLAATTRVEFALAEAAIVESGPEVQLSFAARGSFGNLTKLVGLISTMPYAIRVSGAELGQIGPGQWQGQFSLRVTSFEL